MSSVNFTPTAAKRIRRSVHFTERADLLPRGHRRQSHSPPAQLLTVKITEQDEDDPTKFAWRQEYRTADGWEEVVGGMAGTLTENPAYQLDEEATDDLTDQHVCIANVALKMAVDPNNANAAAEVVRGWVIVGTPGGDSSVLVKVVSNASGGGKYNGRVWETPTADVSASGNLAAADLGTDPGSNDALVLNMQELGQSTHDLTTGTPKATHFLGKLIYVNSDGTKVVAINGTDWENCS